MGKIGGIVLVLGGIAGSLYQWIEMQRERQMRVEEFCLFLHKTIFQMETEKVKIIEHFAKYDTADAIMKESFQEISKRLRDNIYPNGVLVWEEVLKRKNWHLDKEMYFIILKSGTGFFGKSREENICFLKKQLEKLENQQIKTKEKDANERKVWIPVGMLSGIMLVILLL